MSKRFHIKVVSFVICLSSMNGIYGQDPVINEFMSRNDTTLLDQDGDYPDWIELYNPGDQSVNLVNYGISDNLSEARKWLFPEVSIPPKGYLLLFASGKDRSGIGELHTNFKISSDGEPLVLSNQAGAVIDLVDSTELADDQVLARIPDGSSQWLISFLPTPAASNEIHNQLHFSHKQGFYKAPFHLSVSSLNGDTVRYTLDGSLPTDSSDLVTEALYMDFLDLKPNFYCEIPTSVAQEHQGYKAWELPSEILDKVHVVKSASFCMGERSSEVYTHTYVVDSKVNGDFTMPVISISADGADLFGFEKGIFVPGINLKPDNLAETGNYFRRGENWERPVHIEFFEPDGTLGFSQDAGIRVHGGLTRHAAQKSIRVYARDKYGKDSFEYPLLPQKRVDSYKRFLLRTSMANSDDNAIIRDVLAHELSRDLNFEIQDYQPVVVYINGEYWGIHTLRDRIDEHYLEYSFGVDSDSVDVINANPYQVVSGTNSSYMELAGFIKTHDLLLDSNYEIVKTQVDVLSLVDYMVAEMFFFNWDWPGNNQKLWRSQKPDGKWRWIFFDLDIAYFGSENVFERAILEEGEYPWDEEPVSSFLMRNLLKNEEFKSLFISRMAEILKETFTPSRIYQNMNSVVDLYRIELPRHISRWHYPYSVDAWEDDIANRLLTFLLNRACKLATEAMQYFDLEEFGYNCYPDAYIEDHLLLAPNPNNGNFYIQNNTPRGVLWSLTVLDNTGRIVYMEEEVFLGEFEKKYIDLAHLDAGVYYLNYSSAKFPSYATPNLSAVKPIVIY